MKKSIFLLFFCTLCITFANAAAGNVKPLQYNRNSVNKVFYLPQFSEFKSISDSEMQFFKKTLVRAGKERVKAVILELDTPGGSVETAFKYLSIMEKSPVPTVVYLNPNGISAGMVIALGADRIAISPNGLIGDAMPISMDISGVKPITEKPIKNVPEKAEKEKKPVKPAPNRATPAPGTVPTPPTTVTPMLDDILKEVRALREKSDSPTTREDKLLADQKFLTVFFKMLQVLAEKNGRPVKVIRAMADPYVVLNVETDGFEHNKRSPLTLSAREAEKLKVVDHIAANRSDLLNQLGLGDAEVVEIKRTPTEQIGAFLATPALAGLLLVIGLVGIFVEIKTPGFGVPGVLGISALTLFFLGHIASGASDWGPMVVFFVGLVLLALEIFLVPGFGLVGLLGIVCILVSFFWAFGFDNISTALRVVTFSLTTAIVIMVLLAVYVLPKTRLFRSVSLEMAMKSDDGFTAQTADNALIGSQGVTLTPLRPSGTVKINHKRHDAVSAGDFLESGEKVTVIACNGFQVVVERCDDEQNG